MVPSIRSIITNVHWISDNYKKNHFGLNFFFVFIKGHFIILYMVGRVLYCSLTNSQGQRGNVAEIFRKVSVYHSMHLFFRKKCGIVTVSFRILDLFKYNLKKMYILYSLHMLLYASKGDVRTWLHHLDCLHNEWAKAQMCDVSKRA